MNRDPLRLLPAVVAATGIGLAGINVLPLLMGALMDGLGLGEAGAGLLGSLELVALALVSLGVAAQADRWSRRRLALLGAATAVLGHVASAFAEGFLPLAAARLVAGAGEGAALGAGNAAAAASPSPDRLFAQVVIVTGVGGALLLTGMPHAIAPWGAAGAFGVLAAVALLCLPFVAGLPPAPADRRRPPGVAGDRQAALVLVSLLLFATAEGAVWAFTERIGIAAGLARETVGAALGVTTLLGLLGAGAAAWLGTRGGRTRPIAIGVVGVVAATAVLAHASGGAMYLGALLCWSAAYFFCMPYLLGTAAALDPGGRVSAAAAGVAPVGLAFGPVVAGLLVARFGHPALAVLAVVAGAAALALLLPVTRALERESRVVAGAAGPVEIS